jgi:uncharacterized protein Yka (UPF0111/DUF47 family)
MLNNVMPQRGTFFELLSAHTDRLVGGANATLRLLTGLGQHSDLQASLIEEVNLNETSADEIKAQYIHLLYESFTTPFDRNRMHSLILDLDRVLDTLQSVANAVSTYHIANSTAPARTMASLASDACLRLNRSVIALGHRKHVRDVEQMCREVDDIESQACVVMREAVTQLFRVEGDEAAAWQAMKLRRLYVAQEAVLDGCKRAAKTLEEIVIESA